MICKIIKNCSYFPLAGGRKIKEGKGVKKTTSKLIVIFLIPFRSKLNSNRHMGGKERSCAGMTCETNRKQ
jgi:hypothetical protein